MPRLEVYLLYLCVFLLSSNLLGPEALKKKRKITTESDDDLDTKNTDTMYRTIEIFEEYIDALRNSSDVPEDWGNNKDNNLDKVEYYLKLLKKGLLRHVLTATCKTEGDIQKFNEVLQNIMDSLPPLVQAKEPELSPELKEAKELYEAALLTLLRRTPEFYRLVFKVRLPIDTMGYILGKMKLVWSYLTREGHEWELEKIKADLHRAVLQLKKAADTGYAPAKIKLAWSYLFGENIEMDFKRAKNIFEEMAAEGNADAHAGMGFLYATGIAVPVSQAKAVVHYMMGALGDSDFAQMALAYRYWSGNTVPSSCPKAMDLYMRVADKVASNMEGAGPGNIDPERDGFESTNITEYYQQLAEKTIREKQAQPDYERDLRYFEETAKLDNPVAQVGLGVMYLKGRGVPKDPRIAFKYFTMAANQGWAEGQLQLGIMYLNGIGVRRDFKQANQYFSLASQTGHVLALYHLGQMHAQGLGVKPSCFNAVVHFMNVSKRGPWATRILDAHNSGYPRGVDSEVLQRLWLAELGYSSQQWTAAVMLETSNHHLFNELEIQARYRQLVTRSKVPRQDQSINSIIKYKLSSDDELYPCRQGT